MFGMRKSESNCHLRLDPTCERSMLLVEDFNYLRYRLMFKFTTFVMPTSQLPTLSGLSWRTLYQRYQHSTPNTSSRMAHQTLVNCINLRPRGGVLQ